MKIKSIKITNLFGIFDYNIAYPTDSNILIITGPNGYGKTQILNIIYNVFDVKLKDYIFFENLSFSKIEIDTTEGILKLSKVFPYENNSFALDLSLEIQTQDYSNSLYFSKALAKNRKKRYINEYRNNIGIIRFEPNKYNSLLEANKSSIDKDEILDSKEREKEIIASIRIYNFLSRLDVYLIKEQRILKIEKSYSKEENKKETTVKQQIGIFSKELRQKMMYSIDQSFELAQSIDSTYPKRLMQEKEKFTKEEYESRLKIVIDKQKQLKEIGLFENEHEELEYSKDDAKALTVYLKDLEEKTTVFDKLLAKIDLFIEIINERGFAFKQLEIDKRAGLIFKNHKGEKIEIDQLSSGEKNKIALYYELIFNIKPNSLVLIDEPEISLHVSWQKEFLSDLEKIIALHKGMQAIVATHSPTIISDRWDWVHNLEMKKELTNG